MGPIRALVPRLVPFVLFAIALPAYFLAYQANPRLHYGIGRLDGAFLADASSFYPPVRMSGPVRHPDGSVEVREFVGRLTKRNAGFLIPFYGLRSPLELTVRCHRFGLAGTVVLTVNGHHVQDFVFTKQSYPWGGIRAVVPQDVAELGPLKIDLSVEGGDPPPSHLPPDLGLGVDWLEVSPLSKGVVLLPTAEHWIRLFIFLVSGYVFLRFSKVSWTASAILLALLILSVLAMEIAYPVTAETIVSVAWICFPLTMFGLWLAELVDRLS